MDKFIENIKKLIKEDKVDFISKNNIEDLYVWELANKWIDINIKDKNEFEKKMMALGNILNNNDFQLAIKNSVLALQEKDSNVKAIQIAELIKRLKETEEYKENSTISGYKILNKYEDSKTYKTDSFIVHTNIMLKLYEYLNKKVSEVGEG